MFFFKRKRKKKIKKPKENKKRRSKRYPVNKYFDVKNYLQSNHCACVAKQVHMKRMGKRGKPIFSF